MISEEFVTFKSSKDGILLNGTILRVPNSKSAILFIGGSGKTDRDETAPEKVTYSGKKEKLFKHLAEAFENHGISSFRYDKRGVLDENGKVDREIWKSADRDHLISDAEDALRFTAQYFGLDYSEIIIIGHSEGSIIAVEAALSIGGSLKAMLLLGAQARSMKDMLHYQIVESSDAAKSGQNEKPEDDYEMALNMVETSEEVFAPDDKPMNWYRQFLKAPANADRIKGVNAKIAVFQGEDDFFTPIDEVTRFQNAGLKSFEAFSYPELGHCFSKRKNGQPTFGPIEETVLKDMLMFVSRL